MSKMMETGPSAQEIMLEPQASVEILTDTCEICRDIWLCFLDPTTFRQVRLGYSDDPLAPRCPRHSPLFIYWRDNSKVDLPDGVDAIDWDQLTTRQNRPAEETLAMEKTQKAKSRKQHM